MVGHKKVISTLKKIMIIQNIFSTHNRMKLEINKRRKLGKFTYVELNNTFLNKQLGQEQITKVIRKYFEIN